MGVPSFFFTSAALASLYLYFILHRSEDEHPIFLIGLKVAPIVFMLVSVLRAGTDKKTGKQSRYSSLMAVGFFFCGLGDISLALYRNTHDDKYFLSGIATFLIGHVFYIFAFLTDTSSFSLKAGLPLWVFSATMYSYLLPGLKPQLVVPVLIYAIVIGFMGWRSLARFGSSRSTSTSQLFAFLGAVSFMFSDSVIAVNRFRFPIENDELIVMVTYYLGQALIAASAFGVKVVSHKKKS